MDTSLGVAIYVHSAVCIAIRVGLGPVKRCSQLLHRTRHTHIGHFHIRYSLLDPIQLILPNEHILPHQEKHPQ